jgi:purine-binding chemotaxis protein CheW
MHDPAPMTSDLRGFIAFRVGAQSYALPADLVSEVIRPPTIARVPHSPRGLLGIASLRGSVLPVASLPGLLGAPPQDATARSRVLVLRRAPPLGLAVDAVDTLVNVEPEAIETDQAMMGAQPGERLTGVFRIAAAQDVTKVLDLDALLAAAFVPQARPRAATGPGVPVLAETEAGGDDTPRLVVFEVFGQDYGLALNVVREVASLPAQVARAPRSEGLVLGVVDYRGGLLPLFSLRGLLGLPIAIEADLNQKVIVTTIGGAVVGLVVDRLRAIVLAEPSRLEPVPRVLAARTGGETRISAILRLEGEGGLISVLSPERVFREEIMQRLGQFVDEGGAVTEDDETVSETLNFLVFRLGEDEFALPIDKVEEVTSAPTRTTRVPNTPEFLEGVINLRGEVLPIVDQRRRFNMAPAAEGLQRRLVVVRTDEHRAGLIVDSVSEVLRSSKDQIEPAPDLTGQAGKLVNGVLNLRRDGRILLVLDPAELLTRAEIGLLEGLEAEDRRTAP